MTDIIIKMVLNAWRTHIERTDELFNTLTDEQLGQQIAPGRNRGIYLMGHLAAVHDGMLPLLELGNPLYPQLWDQFVEQPDKAVTDLPSTQAIRGYWKEINAYVDSKMNCLPMLAWFERHTSVSPEDFVMEPHRNKLNIVINRTNHLANHLGQLLLIST